MSACNQRYRGSIMINHVISLPLHYYVGLQVTMHFWNSNPTFWMSFWTTIRDTLRDTHSKYPQMLSFIIEKCPCRRFYYLFRILTDVQEFSRTCWSSNHVIEDVKFFSEICIFLDFDHLSSFDEYGTAFLILRQILNLTHRNGGPGI